MNQQIDPRGQRFAAALTSVVLATVLLLAPSPQATALLAVQAALFGAAVLLGVQRTPVATLYRVAVRPWLGRPRGLEDAAPPRFAQGVGLGFAVAGLLGFVLGAPVLGLLATGGALAAALLNAVFGLCLGCELYLLTRRWAPTPTRAKPAPST